MAQEEKDLLLKDLCARLPYGVKVHDVKSSINSSFMNLNHINGAVGEVFISYMNKCRTAPIEDVKPYLFPLSSMTEEQKIIYGDLCYAIIHSLAWDTQAALNELNDWLNKNHFDHNNLIPMDLALDATNLNIY